MAYIFQGTLCALVLALSVVSGRNTGAQCELTKEGVEKMMMSCMVHDPSLMLQIMEHMNNPSSMANFEFICSNKNDLVDLLVCMENKLAGCMPEEMKSVIDMLPNKQHLQEAMTLICEHKSVMTSDCMTGVMPQFMACVMGNKDAYTPTSLSKPDLENMVCKIVRSEESCVKQVATSCSKAYIDLMFKFLEVLFPVHNCPALTVDMVKGQAMNNALGSILVHGQPLLFQPKGGATYNVVQG